MCNAAGVAGFADGAGAAAMFNSPAHMTLNEDESLLYVADRRNNRIRAVTLATSAVTTVAGRGRAASTYHNVHTRRSMRHFSKAEPPPWRGF